MIALLASAASAQEIGGFLEVRGTGYAGVDGTPWQLVERVRPELSAPLLVREDQTRVALGVAVEAALAEGRDLGDEVRRALEDSALGPVLAAGRCEWPAPANDVLRIDGASDYLSVERLYADVYTGPVDLRVGRQAVNWGSALFFNPTDPFPEVLVSEPWRPRRGVNVARATVPVGEDHQVQLVAGANDAFTAERAAARATVSVLGTDVSLVGAWRGEVDEGLAGVDLRGTLGVGWWIEGAWHARPDEAWEELAVGVDYSFPLLETLVLTAQYYRNGRDVDASTAGLASSISFPDCDALALPEPAAPDPFAPFVSGHDYGLLVASLGVTPDVSLSAAVLQNLGDGSGFAFPTVTVRPTGAVEVSLSAQLPYALDEDGGEFRPSPADLRVGGLVPGRPIDFSGLVPEATVILWSRLNF